MAAIQDFYKDQTIFLTGATGSVGKLLIEKLLLTCDINKIYLLIRPKKGKSVEERFEEFFKSPCFDRLKRHKPDFKDKIRFLRGDCEQLDLGLCENDQNILIQEATVVIHAAANVKFEQSLKCAAYNNVRAVRDVLELTKKISKLQLFIHVSTAFSHCLQGFIKEEFYEPPMTGENFLELVELVDEDILKAITPHILGKWPNTYVFSKAIAEDLVKRESANLTIAVARPAIILSAYEEPMPGWTDNIYGIGGLLLAICLGVVRILHADPEKIIHGVACDHVVNNILAIGWATAQEKKTGNRETKIYNFVEVNKTVRVKIKDLRKNLWKLRYEFPPTKIVWYPDTTFTSNKHVYEFCTFWLYFVIPHIADFFCRILGKEAIAVPNAARLNRLLSELSYFVINHFSFETKNVDKLWEKMTKEDKQKFTFVVEKYDVEAYARNCCLMGRRHVMKEPDETIPKGFRKLVVLTILHFSIIAIFYYFLFKLIVSIVYAVFW